MRVDFGEGTQSLEISSAGTSSGTIIAQGSQLRIRPETAIEKGSALTGLDAVIDYVKIKAAQSGTAIVTEQVGLPTSINSTENFISLKYFIEYLLFSILKKNSNCFSLAR